MRVMRPMAGFTLIELMIVIAIIAIIAAIAIPNLIEARKSSNEAAAIGSLRAIGSAQSIFREGDKDGNSVLDYATSMAALGAPRLIDPVLGSGTKQGYVFWINTSDSQWRYVAHASPAAPGKSGDRYFRIDETGLLRFATDAPPIASSPPVGQ